MSAPSRVSDDEVRRGLAVLVQELGEERAKAFLLHVADRRIAAGVSGIAAQVLSAFSKDPSKAVGAVAAAGAGLLAFSAIANVSKAKPDASPGELLERVVEGEPREIQATVRSVRDATKEDVEGLVRLLGPGTPPEE